MKRKMLALVGSLLVVVAASVNFSQAQGPIHNQYYPGYQLTRFFYYPYHYYPHNYWPAMAPRWPEAPGMPYMKPPAYQAYPAFKEPNWRYEMWMPQRYHRGNHFWLDQF